LLIQQSVASFQDGEFQAAFAAVAGDLSTAATDAALSSATSGFGSVVIVNPNTSTGRTTQPGGGGTTVPITFTSAAVSITATTNTNANTAANTISPTR
jgi:acyl dehydratase